MVNKYARWIRKKKIQCIRKLNSKLTEADNINGMQIYEESVDKRIII